MRRGGAATGRPSNALFARGGDSKGFSANTGMSAALSTTTNGSPAS